MSKVLIIGVYAKEIVSFRGNLIKDMVKEGHQVTAVAPEIEYKGKVEELGADYSTIYFDRTGLSLFRDFRTFISLYKHIKRLNPDLVLTYTIKPVIYGSIAAKAAKVNNIYSLITGLGYVFIDNDGFKKVLGQFVRLLYKIALAFNQKVFFQNPDVLAFLKKIKLVSNRKAVLVSGSGIDLDMFSYVQPVIPPPAFLLVARMIEGKGILEFVEAAKKLKSIYPEVRFQLLGPFDENPSAIKEREIVKWVKQGTIEYLGEVEDVRHHLANCSVFVLPSYREGIPRSTLEALAVGRPVITTDAPGCRETVKEGVNGFLVPIKDSNALAEAMEHFICNPDIITTMGVNSRKLAEEKFDVRKVNRFMLEVMSLKKVENKA